MSVQLSDRRDERRKTDDLSATPVPRSSALPTLAAVVRPPTPVPSRQGEGLGAKSCRPWAGSTGTVPRPATNASSCARRWPAATGSFAINT